jgi:hypothetical protein
MRPPLINIWFWINDQSFTYSSLWILPLCLIPIRRPEISHLAGLYDRETLEDLNKMNGRSST